jgi:hypothetical protein
MDHSRIGLMGLLLFSLGGTAAAQQRPVDVDKLPINIPRIQRELRQSTIREERSGLNIRYIIDVYGQAPPLEFFTKQDNLLNGPVPYGGPTHREVLEVITPPAYRAPAMDFGALIRWLGEKAKKEK